MARDTDALKIELWAATGDRGNPENYGLDRSTGWTVGYEQAGSGQEPEREVFNQLFRELSGLFLEIQNVGILVWANDVDYRAGAIVAKGELLYRATGNSGPGLGGAVDPASGDATKWARY